MKNISKLAAISTVKIENTNKTLSFSGKGFAPIQLSIQVLIEDIKNLASFTDLTGFKWIDLSLDDKESLDMCKSIRFISVLKKQRYLFCCWRDRIGYSASL